MDTVKFSGLFPKLPLVSQNSMTFPRLESGNCKFHDFPDFPCLWNPYRADRTHPPFGRSRHRNHIQRPPREVVSVRARLAVKACAEAFGHRRPVQHPDVPREDSVQHLHVGELRDGGAFVFGNGVCVFRQRDAQTAAELCGAQVYGDDLGEGEKSEVFVCRDALHMYINTRSQSK